MRQLSEKPSSVLVYVHTVLTLILKAHAGLKYRVMMPAGCGVDPSSGGLDQTQIENTTGEVNKWQSSVQSKVNRQKHCVQKSRLCITNPPPLHLWYSNSNRIPEDYSEGSMIRQQRGVIKWIS